MLNRLFEQYLNQSNVGLNIEKGRRLVRFLFLGASIVALNAFAFVMGSSLFLGNAGPENLPLSYGLMGLLSIPAYASFLQVVDSLRRPQLFQYMLLGTMLLSVVLWGLTTLDFMPAYYAIFIGFYLQRELYADVLFPSLVSDYFTTLEYKRYASLLAMAMAVGGLFGGGLASLLAGYVKSENMLLCLPILGGIAIAQVFSLDRSEQQLSGSAPERGKSSLLKDLQIFPGILKRYRIVIFLAASALLVILLAAVSEFQFFSIYSQAFPDEQTLTRFLGWIAIASNAVQLVVLFFFTQPLIERLGVGPMNLAYPMTTLVSFAGLAIVPNLASAIGAHLNKDPLELSINKPIHSLNYNAVPHRFVGRVRAVGDGLFSAIGLGLAGGLLWLCQSVLEPEWVPAIGIALSILFLGVRYFQGQSYLQSLLALLRSGSVNLEDVSEGLTHLPSMSVLQIRQLLGSENRNDRILGLKLAARLENPTPILSEIQDLLPNADLAIARATVKFLSNVSHPGITRYLGSLLASENSQLQLMALEALIASKQSLTNAELRRLLRGALVRAISALVEARRKSQGDASIRSSLRTTSEIQALACVAARVANSKDPEIQVACDRIWQSEMDNPTRLAVIRAIRSSGNRKLIPLVRDVLTQASPEVKREALDALANLARLGDLELAELAAKELAHPDPLVRATAFSLLGVVRPPSVLIQVATGLEHTNLAVRLQAAAALAKYGEKSLPMAQVYLDSPRSEVVEAAIASIGKVGTRRAEEMLFNHLKSDYRLVGRTMRWLQVFPWNEPGWKALFVGIEDYQARLIHRVLYILSSLDREGTLSDVRQILHSRDPRVRANAVEALASGRHRRFVLPVVPLLEGLLTPGQNHSVKSKVKSANLQEALESGDRWISIGALIAAENQFLGESLLSPQLSSRPDPLVQDCADYLAAPLPERDENFFIERVLFLKSISLLSHLFLDELLIVNRALTLEAFPAGETIGEEGRNLDKFSIVYRGSVAQSSNMSKLVPGQSFGEMALFKDYPLPDRLWAETDCVLLTLSRKKFEGAIDSCPRLLTCISQPSNF